MPAPRHVIKSVLPGWFAVCVVHAIFSRGSAVATFLVCTGRANLYWMGYVPYFRLNSAKLVGCRS
jgi:hypothetical protein